MDFADELDRLADVYRSQGYEVSQLPSPDRLPTFAKDFRIELVGRRGSEGVLIAVRKNRDDFAADADLPRYAEVTGMQPGWRFDFAILEGEDPNARELRGAREFSEADISQSLDQTEALVRMGFAKSAVVTGWAALEAAMRIRLRASGQEAGWTSSPRQMLKELYSAGEFSPDEFRRVENASRLRNQIVHGFAPQPSEQDMSEAATVELLGEVTRRLLSESRLASQSA